MTGLDGKGLAALARLAEAFDVAGKVGPDAPMLVLRMADAPVLKGSDARCLDRLVADLRRLFQGPVLVVPHGWTQEQIDVDAARMLVLAEREACAALVDSWPLDSELFGSREFGSRVFEAVAALAARMRARGQK